MTISDKRSTPRRRLKAIGEGPTRLKLFERGGHFIGWFWDECYTCNINVLWPVEMPQVAAFIKAQYDRDHQDVADGWAGKCIELQRNDGASAHIICLKQWEGRPFDYGVLAHECFHATEQIMTQRGTKLTDETSEPYAYLHQSLVTRCLKLVMRNFQ